jgi:hypothetical protein
MGVFDTIYYEGKEYQTKDTPMQCLDLYEIRGNELWTKIVEREWVDDETAFLGGYLKPISENWEPVPDFEGCIEFYDDIDCYRALFWEGEMIKLRKIERQ